MFKRIDAKEGDTAIEGFSYMNSDDQEERVSIVGEDNIVNLEYTYEQPMSSVYVDDIPKLIKALQAAYNHFKEHK